MIINHNMSSLYADRVLNISNDSIMKNMEKLSSGERINRAGDDASGLAVSEVDRIASVAQFNGMNMLTGRFAPEGDSTMQFQIGANMDQNARVYIGTMTASALGLKGAQGGEEQVTIASPEEANMTLGAVDAALTKVNKQRADLGAYQNRFELAAKGINIAAENTQAAESRIRDTEMASEMVEFTKNSILTQAGTAMLAQANSQSQTVLALLQ